jgi:hypothetical protein
VSVFADGNLLQEVGWGTASARWFHFAAHEPFHAEVDTPIMSRDTPHHLFSIACAAIVVGWVLFVSFVG